MLADAVSIFGVPVKVNASFLVVTLMLGYGDPASMVIWLLVSFVCILAHELGHALTARAFGQTVRIELHGLGGSAFHQPKSGGPALTTAQRCLVLIAGPGAGFAVGAIAFAIGSTVALDDISPLAERAYRDVMWITFGYGVLNLVPIMPLDGGQIVHALFSAKLGADRAQRASLAFDVVTGAILLGVSVVERSPRAVYLVLWLVIMRARTVGPLINELRDSRGRAMLDFNGAIAKGDAGAIQAHGERALAVLRAPKNRANVANRVAHEHAKAGRFREAAAMLKNIPAGWTADAWLRARVLAGTEQHAEAIPLLRSIATLDAQKQLALSLKKTGAHDDAVQVAQSLALDPGAAHTSQHLLEEVLYFAGRVDESLAVSLAMYAQSPCARAAYNAACSLAKLDRIDEAFTWLERAVDEGFSNRAHVDADHDLDVLRGDPRFAQIMARYPVFRVAP